MYQTIRPRCRRQMAVQMTVQMAGQAAPNIGIALGPPGSPRGGAGSRAAIQAVQTVHAALSSSVTTQSSLTAVQQTVQLAVQQAPQDRLLMEAKDALFSAVDSSSAALSSTPHRSDVHTVHTGLGSRTSVLTLSQQHGSTLASDGGGAAQSTLGAAIAASSTVVASSSNSAVMDLMNDASLAPGYKEALAASEAASTAVLQSRARMDHAIQHGEGSGALAGVQAVGLGASGGGSSLPGTSHQETPITAFAFTGAGGSPKGRLVATAGEPPMGDDKPAGGIPSSLQPAPAATPAPASLTDTDEARSIPDALQSLALRKSNAGPVAEGTEAPSGSSPPLGTPVRLSPAVASTADPTPDLMSSTPPSTPPPPSGLTIGSPMPVTPSAVNAAMPPSATSLPLGRQVLRPSPTSLPLGRQVPRPSPTYNPSRMISQTASRTKVCFYLKTAWNQYLPLAFDGGQPSSFSSKNIIRALLGLRCVGGEDGSSS